MRVVITVLIFLQFSVFSFASEVDFSVSGNVQSNKVPASFVNVVLITAEGEKLVTGEVTDEQGNFVIKIIKEGKYKLKIQSVGYETHITEAFFVTKEEPKKKFSQLEIRESTKLLESVEIRGQKVMVEQKVDRMILNVKGALLTSGETALNILKQMPGLYVDKDNQIRMVGKSGTVIVMIDGNKTYMGSKELSELLESMSADNINSVEIIKNPSVKYDAEGNSGILDIKLVKKREAGYDASVYGRYLQGMFSSVYSGMSFRFNSNKWAGYAHADGKKSKRGRDVNIRTIYDFSGIENLHDQDIDIDKGNLGVYWNSGVDYQISEKSSVGAVVRFTLRDDEQNFVTANNVLQNETLLKRQNTAMVSNGENFRMATNIHYKLAIDSTSAFSTNIDATVYDYMDNIETTSSVFGESTNEMSRLYRPYNVKLVAAQVDWEKQYGWAKLELGLKASYSDLYSDAAYDSLKNDVWMPDFIQSDKFDYKESIAGGYINLSGAWKKLSWQAGLRSEYTEYQGYSASLNQTNKNHYTKFFPSIFASYSLHKDHQIHLSYGFRIKRPRYWQLNPFPMHIAEGIISLGDPYLRAAITDNLEWSYLFKQKYMLNLSYSNTENGTDEVPLQQNEKQLTIYKHSNIGSTKSFGINLSAPFEFTKWWQSSNNFSYTYSEVFFSNQTTQIDRSVWTPRLTSTQTFLLPWDLKAQLGYFYQGSYLNGGWHSEGLQAVRVGIEKTLMNDQLNLSLKVNDIFKSSNSTITALGKTNNSVLNSYDDSQYVRFAVRYKFKRGLKVRVKKHKQTNRDVMNRI